MFAALLMVGIMVLLIVPGLVLGHGRQPLGPGLLIKVFVGQSLLFLTLGYICKLFPLLIDPRWRLW